jgi:uncharacterized protein DUF6507
MGRRGIHPVAVCRVLAQTKGVAGGFDGYTSTMRSALGGAAAESSSDIVATALAGFLDAHQVDVRAVLRQVEAALIGATAAVNAYLRGDREPAFAKEPGLATTGGPR